MPDWSAIEYGEEEAAPGSTRAGDATDWAVESVKSDFVPLEEEQRNTNIFHQFSTGGWEGLTGGIWAGPTYADRGPAPEPRGVLETGARMAGQGAGMALPMSALMRGMSTVQQAAGPLATKAEQLFGIVLEPFKKAPVSATAIETLAGAGAVPGSEVGGAAGEAVGEIVGAPGVGEAVGRGVGGLTGGVLAAGPLAATAAGSRGMGRVRQAIERETERPKQQAKLLTQEYAADPESVGARISRMLEDYPESGEIQPTMADLAQDPGISMLERQIAASKPEFAGGLREQVQANEAALLGRLRRAQPEKPAATGEVILTKRREDALVALDEQVSRLQGAYDDAVSGARPDSDDAIQAAVEGSQRLQAVRQWADDKSDELYSAVEGDFSVELNVEPLKEGILRSIGDLTKAESGATPAWLQAWLRDADGWEPFRELAGLRRRLNMDLRAANKNPERYNEQRLLTQVKTLVDRMVDRMMSNQEFRLPATQSADAVAQVASRFREATAFRAQSAQVLREGITRKVTGFQGQAAPESAMFDKYFHKRAGAREAAKEFKGILQWLYNEGRVEDAVALDQSLRDYVLHRAFSVTDEAGKPTFAGVHKFNKDYKAALDEFPSIASRLRDVESTGKALEEAGLTRTRTQKEMQTSFAKDYLEEGGGMAGILSKKNPRTRIRSVLREAGDHPEARPALRNELWNEFWVKSSVDDPETGRNVFKYKDAYKFLDDNRSAFEELYSKEEIDGIQQLLTESHRLLGYVPGATRPGRSPLESRIEQTAFAEHELPRLLNILVYATTPMLGWKRGAGLFIANMLDDRLRGLLERDPENIAQSLIEEGLRNPRVGKALLEPVTQKNIDKRLNVLWKALGRQAVVQAHEAEGSEELRQ